MALYKYDNKYVFYILEYLQIMLLLYILVFTESSYNIYFTTHTQVIL